MKILSLNGFKQTTKVVVNQSKNPKTAQIAYKKLKDTTRKFLGIELSPLGTIVADPRVIEAVTAQQPYITLFPNTQAARCIKAIGGHLVEKGVGTDKTFALDAFWQRCVDIFSTPLKMPTKKKEPSQKETTAPVTKPQVQEPQPPAPQEASAVPEKQMNIARPTTEEAGPTPPQPGDKNQQLMEQLIEKVSSVSEELSGIRKVLEKGATNTSAFGPASQGTGATSPLIPLDFEDFLAKQKAKDENGAV